MIVYFAWFDVMLAEKGKAFSLVELLVVIGIIALLMSILLPALAAARAQGKDAVCKSNIRQLVLANMGYTTENDGFYVPAASDMWLSVGPSRGGLHRWHGVRDSWNEPFDPLRGPLAAYLAGGEVKECPGKVRFVKDSDISFEKGCGGYGYNMAYIGSRLWQSGINSIAAWKQAYARTTCVTEVGRPSEVLMFADTAFYQQDKYLIEYSFAEPPFYVYKGKPMTSFYMSPSIHFRHSDRANVGWVDSHVSSKQMAPFEEENIYGVKSSNMMLGWFEPIDNTPFDLK